MEYSKNYRKRVGSLWNYYRDELSDDTNTNNNPNKNGINSESFKYKTSITGSTYNVDEKINYAEGNEIDNPTYDANKSGKKEVEIAVPLKYLINFWRTLDMPLINCDVSLILTWSQGCVITGMERRVIAAEEMLLEQVQHFRLQTQNGTSQLLLYQLKMTKDF